MILKIVCVIVLMILQWYHSTWDRDIGFTDILLDGNLYKEKYKNILIYVFHTKLFYMNICIL